MKPYRIYKIENSVNSLLYVGYTTLVLERRMKTHIQASRSTRPRHLKNPLYIAMRELGIEHFHIHMLELIITHKFLEPPAERIAKQRLCVVSLIQLGLSPWLVKVSQKMWVMIRC